MFESKVITINPRLERKKVVFCLNRYREIDKLAYGGNRSQDVQLSSIEIYCNKDIIKNANIIIIGNIAMIGN